MTSENELYSILNNGEIEEFLVTLTGADNHWMFISSKGALTAGRQDSEHALFPYGTVDKVYASRGTTGPRTFIRDRETGALWEPFADWTAYRYDTERKVSKNMEGTKILFEETNRNLALTFAYSWEFSGRYGFVKTAKVTDLSGKGRRLDVLDGMLNILCPGISQQLQTELSCLTEAYKDNVIDPASGMAIFSLSALVTDKAIPAEALGASVAWFKTKTRAELSLDGRAIDDFTAGRPFAPVRRTCGKRGDLFARMEISLTPSTGETWLFCADRDFDAARIHALSREIAAMDSPAPILEDVERNRLSLRSMIASTDGLCSSALRMHEWHHFANTLFNSLRGGIPLDGYNAQKSDIIAYVRTRNAKAADEAERIIPDGTVSIRTLRDLAGETANPDLARLLGEYLPLAFSRRHGDPSRPWNRFSIKIRDEAGKPVCAFQGNWRDIFQNWEALSASWPGYLPAFVASFLDATTLDGYNPYRVGRDGLDWEKPDPENPWSNIGYWNDHQIIYVQKLFERMNDFFPGTLEENLGTKKYSYARVPYRIAEFEATCRAPRDTIRFDAALDREIMAREKNEGTDARLVHDADSKIYAATLAEKILTLALPKISNIVPGGGIWINTQRPEWNDANNALVGNGLSVVTLAYLRRFLRFWETLLEPLADARFNVAGDVATYARSVLVVLKDPSLADAEKDPETRFAFMKAMGRASDAYRQSIYGELRFSLPDCEIGAKEISALFSATIDTIDKTLATQKRGDGLYHSYNILALDLEGKTGQARVNNLQLMLEGQVAILSSGFLSPEAAASLLERLPTSELYRADKDSYMLYPAKKLPDFLEKNAFPTERARKIPLLAKLLDEGDTQLVTSSGNGIAHFGTGMENEDALSAALDGLGRKTGYTDVVESCRAQVLELYESVFNHASFTGRSGTMYAYEGIGSIYWHMVSKLLLASGEQYKASVAGQSGTTSQFEKMYLSIRDGLGYRRSAENYGAFPWDPYSHTPAGAFARQPGMTGQVKEEILTRHLEYGIEVRQGSIVFTEAPFMKEETLPAGTTARRWVPFGNDKSMEIREGEFGFCFCGIPVVRKAGRIARITLVREANVETIEGATIGRELAEKIFFRTSGIQSIRLECE